MSLILENKELPASNEEWKRKTFTRKELNDLCKITTDMTISEMKKRIKAVTFPDAPRAYIQIEDILFTHNEGRQ